MLLLSLMIKNKFSSFKKQAESFFKAGAVFHLYLCPAGSAEPAGTGYSAII
jgi:hypothetical protein